MNTFQSKYILTYILDNQLKQQVHQIIQETVPKAQIIEVDSQIEMQKTAQNHQYTMAFLHLTPQTDARTLINSLRKVAPNLPIGVLHQNPRTPQYVLAGSLKFELISYQTANSLRDELLSFLKKHQAI